MTPTNQRAVQLIGPDQLTLNADKAVPRPGPHEILCRIEVTGLCFSDLKLLKQFSGHVRKSGVTSGLTADVLSQVQSYVPGDQPTVPGHETVVRVVETGAQVRGVKPGERFLVQTDYRWLKTANSNAAFGYNFEGALQEYVVMDQRVITSPEGDSMLIPASDQFSASAIALVEPWACVEDSYAVRERNQLTPRGRMLVVAEGSDQARMAEDFMRTVQGMSEVVWLSHAPTPSLNHQIRLVQSPADLPNEHFNDILFVSSSAELLEAIFPKLAANGLINIVQCGGRFGRAVTVPVGRVHYGNIRITGTSGRSPQDGFKAIPVNVDIRPSDRIQIVGAGGPMGTMHVIRDLCLGVPGVSVFAGDLSAERLASLSRVAEPLARQNGASFCTYSPKANPPAGPFNYIGLMVPVPALVADAVTQAAPHAIINIFAGIPANVSQLINLDDYVAKQAYFVGTSGSVLEDMKIVLRKVQSRQLDTNLSVAAISGLDGAVEGIRAVEKQLIPGKILVYPSCRGLGLTRLEELSARMPAVAAALDNGAWTAEAERVLLAQYEGK